MAAGGFAANDALNMASDKGEPEDKNSKWADRATAVLAWMLGAFSLIAIPSFFCVLLVLWFPSLGQWSQEVNKPPALNLVGDALGPFASLFSALALIAAFLTLHMQRQELREQREEVRATRREMAQQTKLLKLQGVAAEAQAEAAKEQAKAARSQALRAEAEPIQRYLSTCENITHRLLGIRDLVVLNSFIQALAIETEPLCENQAMSEALRDFRMKFHVALARAEAGDPITDVHKGLDDVLSHLSDVRVKMKLWYSARLAGQDITSKQLEKLTSQSVE